MNMMICSVLPAAEFPGFIHGRFHVAGRAGAHVDAFFAQLDEVGLLRQVHGAHVGADPGRGHHSMDEPVVQGNSNVIMAVITAVAAITIPRRASQRR
jgi:hypothetical protein